jgi:multiple sugar transport system permease protein
MQDTLTAAPDIVPAHKKSEPESKVGKYFFIPWFFSSSFHNLSFLYGIVVAFTDYNLAGMNFIGLKNFVDMLSDPAFIKSLVATLFYAVIVIPLSIILSLWIANALRYHGPKMNAFSKAVFYLPGVTCTTALVIVWKFLVSPSIGIFGTLFKAIGMPQYSLFDRPATSIPTLSLLIVFSGLGQLIIIYAAAMNGIPRVLL